MTTDERIDEVLKLVREQGDDLLGQIREQGARSEYLAKIFIK